MLRDGDFALELAIFETGVPPEFQVWSTLSGQPIAPQDLQLSVRLIRLGNVVDNIGFRAEGTICVAIWKFTEPHSLLSIFRFSMLASNTSGVTTILRDVTQIAAPVADAMGIYH